MSGSEDPAGIIRMGKTRIHSEAHLYDLMLDPSENKEIQDDAIVEKMKQGTPGKFMDENDVSAELYDAFTASKQIKKNVR